MAISQPKASDKLNAPDHALLHRIIAADSSAPVKSLIVDSLGRVGIGTETPNVALEVVGAISASGIISGSNINDSNWNDAYSKRVDSWTAPLDLTSNVASIQKANSTTDGYLSSADWNSFNGKQEVLWDRSDSTLTPHTANDSIDLGSGNFTTTGTGTFGDISTIEISSPLTDSDAYEILALPFENYFQTTNVIPSVIPDSFRGEIEMLTGAEAGNRFTVVSAIDAGDNDVIELNSVEGLSVGDTFKFLNVGARFIINKDEILLEDGAITGDTVTGDIVTGNTVIGSVFKMPDAIATGALCVSFGTSDVSGDYAMAVGSGAIASAENSFATGTSTAGGASSTALGDSTASGNRSFAAGQGRATANYAAAWGASSSAEAPYATAWGWQSKATAQSATAFGGKVLAEGQGAFASGYSEDHDDFYLVAGSEVGHKGAIALGYVSSGHTLKALGLGAIAMGQDVNATADNALGFGLGFTNNTAESLAIGFGQVDLLVESGLITFPNNASLNMGSGNLITTGTGRFDSGLLDSSDRISVDLNNRQLKDTSGDINVSWQWKYLYGYSGYHVVDWGSLYLKDDSDYLSVDWGNRQLADSSGLQRLDWENLLLTDGSDALSLNWSSRELYANDGSDIILSWNTPGLADFGDTDLKTTGTAAFGTAGSQGDVPLQLLGGQTGALTQLRLGMYDTGFGLQLGGISVPHPVAGEEDINLINIAALMDEVHFMWGGGYGNAPTSHEFLTSPNWTTVQGILRYVIDKDGNHYFGDGGTTNYLQIAADGELSLHGTAKVRKNIEIAIGSIKPPATHPASWVDLGIAGAWEFSDGTTETVILEMPLPLDIDRTEDVVVDIGWASPSTSANCVWETSYLLRSEDEAIDAAADDTLQEIAGSSSTAEGLVKTSFTIPAADISDTDLLLILKLERIGGNANDTLEDVAHLTAMNFNYVSNKLGEATE